MLLTQEPSPASMIQSWGRAGDDEIVILGIILRDFLVDFLRGPAKGVLPGEPKRSATQIIPKVPSTGQKLTKKTSTDQSGLEGSTARFFPISTGTGNCSGHQLRHPSFSSRQPHWSSVLKMSRISDRLNVKPLARQRLARFVFPSRSKRRRRRAIRAKRRLYVRITPVGCHTWRATGWKTTDGSSTPSRWPAMSLREQPSYMTGQRTRLH
jgi:hypothetical protein